MIDKKRTLPGAPTINDGGYIRDAPSVIEMPGEFGYKIAFNPERRDPNEIVNLIGYSEFLTALQRGFPFGRPTMTQIYREVRIKDMFAVIQGVENPGYQTFYVFPTGRVNVYDEESKQLSKKENSGRKMDTLITDILSFKGRLAA